MSKDSLALKYRPKKFSEVIGQPVIIKAFTNALKCNSMHHAYIFAGGMGTGKTSMARILAAMENCKEKGKDPCGECRNCKDIFTGNHLEVNEIDAASHGGVDDIRAMQNELYQTPIECRVKYVIIDEAHSLSRQGAEAALKIIEEPPEYVKFILCTTEPQSLKPTIHSRCILWTFNKVSWQELDSHLNMVAKAEELDYDPKALKLMAKYSKGSVRNALQNLQTVINYVGDERIEVSSTVESLGVVDDKLYFELIDHILEGKIVDAYISINKILKEGKEVKTIYDGIYGHFNNLMMIRLCKAELSFTDFSEDEIKRYAHQSSKMGGEFIIKAMNLLGEMAFEIEYSVSPEYLFNKFIVSTLISHRQDMKRKERK